eukprot:3494627-Rhodomonas_salina.3
MAGSKITSCRPPPTAADCRTPHRDAGGRALLLRNSVQDLIDPFESDSGEVEVWLFESDRRRTCLRLPGVRVSASTKCTGIRVRPGTVTG